LNHPCSNTDTGGSNAPETTMLGAGRRSTGTRYRLVRACQGAQEPGPKTAGRSRRPEEEQ
jgi:hypothetical protein